MTGKLTMRLTNDLKKRIFDLAYIEDLTRTFGRWVEKRKFGRWKLIFSICWFAHFSICLFAHLFSQCSSTIITWQQLLHVFSMFPRRIRPLVRWSVGSFFQIKRAWALRPSACKLFGPIYFSIPILDICLKIICTISILWTHRCPSVGILSLLSPRVFYIVTLVRQSVRQSKNRSFCQLI